MDALEILVNYYPWGSKKPPAIRLCQIKAIAFGDGKATITDATDYTFDVAGLTRKNYALGKQTALRRIAQGRGDGIIDLTPAGIETLNGKLRAAARNRAMALG